MRFNFFLLKNLEKGPLKHKYELQDFLSKGHGILRSCAFFFFYQADETLNYRCPTFPPFCSKHRGLEQRVTFDFPHPNKNEGSRLCYLCASPPTVNAAEYNEFMPVPQGLSNGGLGIEGSHLQQQKIDEAV